MSLSGSIEDLPLLEILQVVSFCQKTGFLKVRSPHGDAGVVFRDGRVITGYVWDVPSASPGTYGQREVRARLGMIIERLVLLREGDFAFNLAERAPSSLGGRDLEGDTLADGINPEELMLELARKLDEDRRDCTASLAASFTEPQPEAVAPSEPEPELPGQEASASQIPKNLSEAEASAGPARWAARSEETGDAPAPFEDEPAPVETDAETAPLEELEIEEAESPAGPTVLLVDDEREVRDIVGKQLRQAGFDVHASGSVATARREMQRLSAKRRRFLLVVDLGLPPESGSSFRAGLDVVRIASGLPAPPPVLLMSEAIDEKLMGRARRLGVSLLAFKPGLSKLDPLQYAADLRAFGDKLARDLLPRLAGRRDPGRTAPAPALASATPADDSRERALAAAAAEIAAHPDADLVAFLLLRAARACFVRTLLFVVKDDGLVGLSGFGPVTGGRSLDLLGREICVALDQPSPFAEVAATGRTWCGRLPTEGPLSDLLSSIGRLQSSEGAILPLRAAGETLAMVYADAPDGTALSSVDAFAGFVEQAGRALDNALAARPRAVSSGSC